MTRETKLSISLAVTVATAVVFAVLWGNQQRTVVTQDVPGPGNPGTGAPKRDGTQAPVGKASTPTSQVDTRLPVFTPPPEFGWLKDREQEFVFSPGDQQEWALSPNPHGYVHYIVKAQEPVDVAVAVYIPDRERPVINCPMKKVLAADGFCIYDQARDTGSLRVTDTRDLMAGIALGVIIGEAAAKHAASQNRVTITFFKWGCVEHCEVRP